MRQRTSDPEAAVSPTWVTALSALALYDLASRMSEAKNETGRDSSSRPARYSVNQTANQSQFTSLMVLNGSPAETFTPVWAGQVESSVPSAELMIQLSSSPAMSLSTSPAP
jgi:hypothetical protein